MTIKPSVDPRQQKLLDLMRYFMQESNVHGFMILGYQDGKEFKSVKVINEIDGLVFDCIKTLSYHLNDHIQYCTLHIPSDPPHPPQ